MTSKNDIKDYADTFLGNLNPENYCNNVFKVKAQHLHGTIPTSSEIPFEIKYHAGKEKNSGTITDNKNTVYYMKLYVRR